MDKYLLEILKEMNTIIIPGLGALTITNSTTGEIMFMPYLKYDDGKLVRYIAEKEGWSENDAQNLIAKYVREIEAKLNVGDSYDMYRFGSFTKTPSGDVEFIRWKETSSGDREPDYVEPALGNDTIDEPTPETVSVAKEEPIIDEEPDPEHSALEQVEVIKETPFQNEEVILVEEAQLTEYIPEEPTPETKFELYTEEDQWNDDLDLPPVNTKIERPKKPILEKTQKDKKKRRPVLVIALIAGVLVIGGTLTIALFYNSFSGIGKDKIAESEKQETTITEKTSTEERQTEKEEIETTSAAEPEQTETTVEPSAETQTANSAMIQTSTGQVDPARPFHLIAGAFTVQENAERFRDKLRETGNSNAEIIGQFDGLYVVSAGSYSSNDEALNAKKENTTISKSWIFRWP